MPLQDTTSNDGSLLIEQPKKRGRKEDTSPIDAAQEVIKSEEERLAILAGLAHKITTLFQERASQRRFKEVEWAEQQRLFNSPLQGTDINPDKPLSTDGFARRRPEPNIVRTKCETAIANCVSLQFAAADKNWDLFPPANNISQAVADACRAMEKEIETQLSESKYSMHSRRAIEDRVILGTGVLKGPVNTGKLKVKYEQQDAKTWVPKVTTNYAPKVEHVSLWRFYPDMTVNDSSEIQDAIEVHPMTAIELSQYADHPGFDGDAIRLILAGNNTNEPIKPDAYNDTLQSLSADMWQRNPYLYKNRYVVLEYHGPVTYDELDKLGLSPTYKSPTNEYYGEVWVCCGKVIRMELENIEGYFEVPYCIAPWKRDPSSVFGFGHPLLLADAQRVVTQAYHMILDNASITSGPQVAMFQKYIQPVDGDWTLQPNKVWLLTDPSQQIQNAIQFFNPTNVINEIMPVLDLAMRFADEESATTGLAAGISSPENTETATGQLAMRMASTTLLDFMAEEWDEHVTEKIVRRMYAWNMQYNPKPEIKGDYCIDVKSSSEYKNKQMYVRDLERLSMEAAQNPEMAMVINMEELQKARLALMHLPSNRIIKNEDEIKQAQQQAQQKPDPAQIEAQVKMIEAQTAQGKLQLDQQRLQFDAHQAMQQAQWDHEEKMGSNYARLQEAEASVIKARSETQVEMLKLAQKDDHFKAQLMNDQQLEMLNKQAQVFLASMEEHRKQRELDQTDEELKIKRQKGTGI